MERCWNNHNGNPNEDLFQVIEPRSGSTSYTTLVGWSRGRKMKASISFDKDILKIKGKDKKFIIPLDTIDGRPLEKPNDDNTNVWWIYQIMQNNEDNNEPNKNGDIFLGSPMSIS